MSNVELPGAVSPGTWRSIYRRAPVLALTQRAKAIKDR
jgi:hypothetical protein